MPGLLTAEPLERVYLAWRRTVLTDPEMRAIDQASMRQLANALNEALTGDAQEALEEACELLAAQELNPTTSIRVVTTLVETFVDEIGARSGAEIRSLVATLGQACASLSTGLVTRAGAGAKRDHMTALPNRQAFDEALAAGTRAALDQENSLVLAHFDLDNFKQINDTEGHPAGDDILRGFAAALRDELPEDATAYRTGGDEFCALFPDNVSGSAQELVGALRDRGVAEFSCGIARISPDVATPEELYQAADQELYRNKEARKSQPDAS